VITHGHCHPEIAAAIAKQASTLDHVLFAGCTHAPAEELAESLIRLMPPPLTKVFFSDNGSTAVEVALKMTLQYWHNVGQPGRTRIIALKGGYHGDTFGAMAAGKSSGFFAPFHEKLMTVDFVELPTTTIPLDDSPLNETENTTLALVNQYLERYGKETAAIILEPLIQGASGMRMFRRPLVQALLHKARKYGVLLIFDEVMTGFGRTGTMFAFEQLGSTPDLLCLSKGLTGGTMPLSVTIATAEIFKAF
jgi:adenosylmethionine---8-amino-7-oxononanoate aminotransferase